MGIEDGFRSKINKESKQTPEVEVTSLGDYLEMLEKHPLKPLIYEARFNQWIEENKRIENKVSREKYEKKFDKLRAADLLGEEIGYFPINEDEIGYKDESKAWNENVMAGYNIEIIPVYDKENRLMGHKLFRVKETSMDKKKTETKFKIEEEFIYSDTHAWFYEEKEKEKEYNELVRKGEMVYLGEISFDDYCKRIAEKIETFPIWVFDETKEPRQDVKKYYARIKRST